MDTEQWQRTETNPPSGTTIGAVEGKEDITIDCKVFGPGGFQQFTVWHIVDQGKSVNQAALIDSTVNPNFVLTDKHAKAYPPKTARYRDRLVIKKMTSDLDRKTIYCGGVSLPKVLLNAATFSLRINCKSCHHDHI